MASVQFGQHAPARRVILHLSDTHLLGGDRLLGERYDTAAKVRAFYGELVQRLDAIPGVRSAAAVRALPMTGRLEIGETSVVIAASAPHLQAAFQACEWAIKELKRTVPIWKKEVFDDGEEEWVGAADFHR